MAPRPLTFEERKRRIPIGAQLRVAERTGVKESFVSEAMRDEVHPKRPETWEKLRRVQRALAAEMGLPLERAFAQTEQEARRPRAKAS